MNQVLKIEIFNQEYIVNERVTNMKKMIKFK